MMKWLLASLFFVVSCTTVFGAKYPPEASRKTPPKKMEQLALKVGASAPQVQTAGVIDHNKSAWSSTGKDNIAYVFYRGYW